MHGGKALVGPANPSFKTGRYSRYLPADIDELYQQALSNPDLLEMSDHIALLESRIGTILAQLEEEEAVPRWSSLKQLFSEFETRLLSDEKDQAITALGQLHEFLDRGAHWDRSWDVVNDTLEQLRKMADTEIKRKKDLNLMVPIERVMVLMAAVATAVKRNVTNPIEIAAVYREIEMLRTGKGTLGEPTDPRMPANSIIPFAGRVIDATPE